MKGGCEEPRFLGWREWAPIAPSPTGAESEDGEETLVAQRRAIWSDDDVFNRSDGDTFDFKSWWREYGPKGKKGAEVDFPGARRSPCGGGAKLPAVAAAAPAVCPAEAVPVPPAGRPAPNRFRFRTVYGSPSGGNGGGAAAAALLLPGAGGGSSGSTYGNSLASRTLQKLGLATPRLPERLPALGGGGGSPGDFGSAAEVAGPDPAKAVAGRRERGGGIGSLGAGDVVSLSEMATSQHDPNMRMGCRGAFAAKLLEREERLAEQARWRRKQLDEVSRRTRRRAARRRQRAESRSEAEALASRTPSLRFSVEDCGGGEGDDDSQEASRARRLRKVITRIQLGARPGSGRLTLEGAALMQAYKRQSTLRSIQQEAQGSPWAEERTEARNRLRRAVWTGIMERKKLHQREVKKKIRRQAVFDELPDIEKQHLEEIFGLYASKEERVSKARALKCLVELGLRGSNAQERWSVSSAVSSTVQALDGRASERSGRKGGARAGRGSGGQRSSDGGSRCSSSGSSSGGAGSSRGGSSAGRSDDDGGRGSAGGRRRRRKGSSVSGGTPGHPGGKVAFQDFCTDVVSAARREIGNERLDRHCHWFLSAQKEDQAVAISWSQLQGLIKKLGLDMDLLTPALDRARDLGQHPTVSQASRGGSEKEKSHNTGNGGRSPGAGAVGTLATEASPRHGGLRGASAGGGGSPRHGGGDSQDGGVTFDFDAVHAILSFVEEHTDRRRRATERQIRHKTALSHRMFWQYRNELIRLYDTFNLYDVDHSGFLSHDEIKMLLKRIGLQPYNDDMSKVVDRVLSECDTDGNAELNFEEFISLMDGVRRHQRSQREQRLFKEFCNFDVDRSGQLEPKELVACLHAAGMLVTKEQQTVALRMAVEFDSDSTGGISFHELEDLTQHIVERVFTEANERNLKAARSLGFDAMKTAEYQYAFDQLDHDSSGSLSMEEIAEALRGLMIRPPSVEELQGIFKTIDQNSDGNVVFEEFCQLMKIVGHGKGMFSREAPFTLKDVPVDKLRDILRVFPIADSYINNLEFSELLENVSNFTGLETGQNLRELATPIRNARQLIERVRRKEASRKISIRC